MSMTITNSEFTNANNATYLFIHE